MEVLKNEEIYENIIAETQKCVESVLFLTAFCKINALEKIDTYFNGKHVEKRLVVRFRYDDIRTGASDLELYEYCKKHHWKLYFQLDLHVKAYIFDERRCISGSANLTNAGMGITDRHNDEMCSLYEIEYQDLLKIYTFLDDAILMKDEIYKIMKEDLESGREGEKCLEGKSDWSAEIKSLFNNAVTKIFMEELPHGKYYVDFQKNDFCFLKCSQRITESNVNKIFRDSRAFRWLIKQLEESENKELYFGTLTAQLHDDIISEPKPYRKDVKDLLNNLLQWSEALAGDKIVIDVPNHSTRVRLI